MAGRADILSHERVAEYLRLAREACGAQLITDMHVHATEIIKSNAQYDLYERGVFGLTDPNLYKCPKLGSLRLSGAPAALDSDRQNKMSELAFTRAYRFTGPTVLADQMALANVDRVVLLPVARSGSCLPEQMKVIDACCAADKRFLAGYSVRPDLQIHEIDGDLRVALASHDVRVVKIHPNITSMDLGDDQGKRRLHAILKACGDLGLPVLLHGGCSPILGDQPEGRFSTLQNLNAIDWSLTGSPVVIAHFGVYGCNGSTEPASKESLDILNDMLSRHPHMFTDTSGVPYELIRQMIGLLGPERVVFGSDAMYVPMYRQVVSVAHALVENGMGLNTFKTIACENPARVLGAQI